MKEQLEFFKENGYLVVPNALSVEEVRSINGAIDRDLVENSVMWIDRRQTGRCQNAHALLACPEMDVTMRPADIAAVDERYHGKRPLCRGTFGHASRPESRR